MKPVAYMTTDVALAGAFEKQLRTATISFVTSVCPSWRKSATPTDGFQWNFVFRICH